MFYHFKALIFHQEPNRPPAGRIDRPSACSSPGDTTRGPSRWGCKIIEPIKLFMPKKLWLTQVPSICTYQPYQLSLPPSAIIKPLLQLSPTARFPGLTWDLFDLAQAFTLGGFEAGSWRVARARNVLGKWREFYELHEYSMNIQ